MKSFANCGMQTIPVRVDTLQRQTIASTGTEGPQYNQILTPPLASARVHSQTFATVHSQTLEATVQYNKCIKPTPCPSPSLCQFHLLNTPSLPPYPGHQVVKYTTAHGSPHTSKCAFWSSGCSILVSVSSNSPKIHWRPPSDA